MEIVGDHAADGAKSAKIFFKGAAKDTWPGVFITFTPDEYKGQSVLSFNIWHEEEANLDISYRMDLAEGTPIYGGMGVEPHRKSPVQLYLNMKDEDGNPKYPTRILLYRRMPREDSTIWLDNLCLSDKVGTFKEYAYIPAGDYREATEQEKAMGAQLFQLHWMKHVFPNRKPYPEETAAVVLKATACPGETEPMTLSIHALKDLNAVTISFPKALETDNGGTIPAEAFSVRTIRCMNKRPTYQSKSYYANIPMILDGEQTLQIKNGTTRSFWLDVAVPKDAKAGLYKGMAVLDLDGVKTSIPVEIRVRGFVLPDEKTQFFGEYYTHPGDIALIDSDLAYMRSLGMTSLGLCISPNVDNCRYENGKAILAWKEDDAFVAAMEAYKRHGYPCPIILLADPGVTFARKQGLKMTQDEFFTAHQAFWRAMLEEVKIRGWAELIVQPVDEPAWRGKAAMDENVSLLKSLKQVPGLRTEQDGPGDAYFHNVAGPYADVWNYNGAVGTPEVMAKLKKEGKLAMLYNCDVESYRPVTSRYVAGFFQVRSGADGVFNWAFRSFHGSPFNDFDSPLGDTTNYYPGEGKIKGGPGIGLVSSREGIDDFKYIKYLRQLIKEHPGEKADYAESVLNAILESIQYRPAVRNEAHFDSLPDRREDGKGQFMNFLNLRTGWELEDYDRAREIIAGQIEELLGLAEKTQGRKTAVLSCQVKNDNSSLSGGKGFYIKKKHQVTVANCKSAPVLDGKLDDGCWKTAGIMDNFSLIDGGKPTAETKAWVTTDGVNLYVDVECEEKLMGNIIANVRENQGAVYSDDCVEIFIDSDYLERDYYQVCVNSLGYYYTGGSKGLWQPALKTAASRGDDRWTVEMAIPLADLKIKGRLFGFNVCRERRPLEVFELICWSPTGERFGEPRRFGEASFGSTLLAGISLDGVKPGNSSMTVYLRDDKPYENLSLCIDYKLVAKGQTIDRGTVTYSGIQLSGKMDGPLVDLKPFEQKVQLKQGGELQVLVLLKDKDGNILAKRMQQKTVPDILSFEAMWPFTNRWNWRCFGHMQYGADDGQELEMAVWAKSNPDKKTIVKLKKDDNFAQIMLTEGAFMPLDEIRAELRDTKTKRVLGHAEKKIFTIR
ncbi:MAG: DUF4091 domain-containing protein [Victivallales bacterium]|nr:DUF4091 domain-containing protein [Victivallales bacterium]